VRYQVRRWTLPGVIAPEPEAVAWLSKVIGATQPAPWFAPRTWRRNDAGDEHACRCVAGTGGATASCAVD
jgi:hypothetical protein